MKSIILIALILPLVGCLRPILGEPSRTITIEAMDRFVPLMGAHVRLLTELGSCGVITGGDGIVRCLVPTRVTEFTVEVRADHCAVSTLHLSGLPPRNAAIQVAMVCS